MASSSEKQTVALPFTMKSLGVLTGRKFIHVIEVAEKIGVSPASILELGVSGILCKRKFLTAAASDLQTG